VADGGTIDAEIELFDAGLAALQIAPVEVRVEVGQVAVEKRGRAQARGVPHPDPTPAL
jgi:hypothetical protein